MNPYSRFEGIDLGERTDLALIDELLHVDNRFIVDAGCGAMDLSKALAERGARVLAIDPDAIQAEKNRAAPVIPNVGFVETGADKIPVEPKSVDGVVFSYSLHHIPEALYPAVFQELQRILKPDGFVLAMEPVADGDLNEVMRLFHDEAAARAAARSALEEIAKPAFEASFHYHYHYLKRYAGWTEFADRYASRSYNSGSYTEADVRAAHVQSRFEAFGRENGNVFVQPMEATLLKNPKPLPA